MLKLLFALLTIFIPCISSVSSNEFTQKNEVLHAKFEIKSVESDAFLTYWRDDFRKDDEGKLIAICNITYADYSSMYEKYAALNESDRNTINATADYEEGYTIKDSIKELVRIHGGKKQNNEADRRTLNQSSTITIIVVIAVFGMSVICVFFVMKNTNLIK